MLLNFVNATTLKDFVNFVNFSLHLFTWNQDERGGRKWRRGARGQGQQTCSHSVCGLRIHQVERHMRAAVFKLASPCHVLLESSSSTRQGHCCHISNRRLMSNSTMSQLDEKTTRALGQQPAQTYKLIRLRSKQSEAVPDSAVVMTWAVFQAC